LSYSQVDARKGNDGQKLPNRLYPLSAVAIEKPPSLRREFSLEEADGPIPPGGYVQRAQETDFDPVSGTERV